jgi:hypothetical protein
MHTEALRSVAGQPRLGTTPIEGRAVRWFLAMARAVRMELGTPYVCDRAGRRRASAPPRSSTMNSAACVRLSTRCRRSRFVARSPGAPRLPAPPRAARRMYDQVNARMLGVHQLLLVSSHIPAPPPRRPVRETDGHFPFRLSARSQRRRPGFTSRSAKRGRGEPISTMGWAVVAILVHETTPPSLEWAGPRSRLHGWPPVIYFFLKKQTPIQYC